MIGIIVAAVSVVVVIILTFLSARIAKRIIKEAERTRKVKKEITRILTEAISRSSLLREANAKFEAIDPSKDVVVSRWVRLKCMFGYTTYGHNAACPPATTNISETRELLGEYHLGVIVNVSATFGDSAERRPWSHDIQGELLKIEREVFVGT